MSELILVQKDLTEREELKSWCTNHKAEKVSGPLEWSDAVRRYRLHEFDFLWSEGEEWHGYKLKAGFVGKTRLRELTDKVFWATLQRSIA